MKNKRFCNTYIILVAVIFLLEGCVSFRPKPGSIRHLQSDIGFQINEEDITEWTEVYNSYGGLQNDGELYHIIKIDLEISDQTWNAQPFSAEAIAFLEMTDSEIDSLTIRNYYWRFINRTPENSLSPFITDASLLIYDIDAKTLHWICFEI